jgi:hypothetical protein
MKALDNEISLRAVSLQCGLVRRMRRSCILSQTERDIVSITNAEAPIGSRILLEGNLSTTGLSASNHLKLSGEIPQPGNISN